MPAVAVLVEPRVFFCSGSGCVLCVPSPTPLCSLAAAPIHFATALSAPCPLVLCEICVNVWGSHLWGLAAGRLHARGSGRRRPWLVHIFVFFPQAAASCVVVVSQVLSAFSFLVAMRCLPPPPATVTLLSRSPFLPTRHSAPLSPHPPPLPMHIFFVGT